MTATDIMQIAGENMLRIGPALLVFSALACADMMVDFVMRLLHRGAKEYRL